MKLKAKGQLRHRFWGTYSAVIGLEFALDQVNLAQEILGTSWASSQDSTVLLWTGNSEELEAVKVVLGKYGADTKKIDSLARSVDYGEPFTIEIPAVHPNQLRLV